MTARYLAVEALLRVEEGGYSNLVLDAELKKHPLPAQERAFASAVYYRVLEHCGTLDYILQQYIKKPLAKLDAPVRAILRSGLAQLRYMHTPPSAAVNEAVILTRAFGKSSAAGMVNAVLRRAEDCSLETAVFASPAERLAVIGSVSPSIARHFLRCYPEDAEAILTACPEKAVTEIRVNLLKTDIRTLAQRLLAEGAHSAETCTVPGCLLVEFEGSPADSAAFREGMFHVQGRASQLAALALHALPGQKVVDLCAAPGGKSRTIAQEMHDTGTLFSCDVSSNRVSLIEKALRQGGITCARTLCRDASQFDPVLAGADRVLADVPCSGLGILQKKPDIRYKELSGLEQLYALQAAILENAAKCLQNGGRLVYSTCTLNPEENERQAERFIRNHPEFRVKELENLPNSFICGPYGSLSLPDRTGMDGFFICAMEKE